MTEVSLVSGNDDHWPSLPDGVGPHEGREYELMSRGEKHIAMFWDIIPYEFVVNPLGIQFRRLCHDPSMTTIFYRLGHLDDAQRLMEIATNPCTRDPEIEREIGRLLGYQEWEIDAFITHVGATPSQDHF